MLTDDLLADCRVIDISHTVVPGEEPGRPFAIQKALIPADKTFRYDILQAHSHVGTHVEVAAHFYEDGKSVTDYPLDTFYGPGVLFPIKHLRTTAETLEDGLGDVIRPRDIVVLRNDTGVKMTKQDMYMGELSGFPVITNDAARWLADREVKMLVLDFVLMGGAEIAEIREFHDILMGKDVVFVEFVANLDRITARRFYVMSLPIKFQGLDSSFCRTIVLEPKAG